MCSKKKKSICFFGFFNGGGTERATLMIANGLCEKYNIFILNSSSERNTFELKKNIQFCYLLKGNLVLRIIELIKFLRKNKIDIIITVEALSGIYTVPAAKLSGCNNIIWEHANYFQTQGSKNIQKVRQLELKVSDAYICLTERDTNNFKNNFKVNCRLDYIYNAIDNINNRSYDNNSKKIISVGHVRQIKNFIIIPDVGKTVFECHPDWTWEIYGDGSVEYIDDLRNKIKKYGLEKNIFLCGRSSNIESVYRSAAIYVMTSLQEGLPMVLLEAKANKLPIVSFDIETGPSEIVDDGINGYLVKPYDVDEMAEKICCLIEDRKLRRSFSDSAYIGIDKFNIDKIMEKWIGVIDG